MSDTFKCSEKFAAVTLNLTFSSGKVSLITVFSESLAAPTSRRSRQNVHVVDCGGNAGFRLCQAETQMHT